MSKERIEKFSPYVHKTWYLDMKGKRKAKVKVNGNMGVRERIGIEYKEEKVNE